MYGLTFRWTSTGLRILLFTQVVLMLLGSESKAAPIPSAEVLAGTSTLLSDTASTPFTLKTSLAPTDNAVLQRKKPQTTQQSKYAAISFDDGPSPYTPQILSILKKYGIRATFFVLGSNAKANPDLIRQIQTDGHVIGNHSWNHPELIRLSYEELQQELNSTNDLLEELTGQRPSLFRPPYGSTNPAVRSAIQASGMISVLWNVDPTDWALKQSTPVYARVQSGLLEKSLILLHDGGGPREKTVESLPIIIENLQAEGYEFITVPEYLNLERNLL